MLFLLMGEKPVASTHLNVICHTFTHTHQTDTLLNIRMETSLLQLCEDAIMMSSYSVQRFCLLPFNCCICYNVFRCQVCLHGMQMQQLFKHPGWRKAIGGHSNLSVNVDLISETRII